MNYEESKFPKPKRKKKGPAKKKPKAGNYTSRLDALVRRIVRARDQRCVICGSTEALECSHYLGRAKMGTRWDLRNVNLQCAKCHREHHAGNPAYMKFLAKTYGEDIFEELYLQQQDWIQNGGASIHNKEDIYDELMEIWEELRDK